MVHSNMGYVIFHPRIQFSHQVTDRLTTYTPSSPPEEAKLSPGSPPHEKRQPVGTRLLPLSWDRTKHHWLHLPNSSWMGLPKGPDELESAISLLLPQFHPLSKRGLDLVNHEVPSAYVILTAKAKRNHLLAKNEVSIRKPWSIC